MKDVSGFDTISDPEERFAFGANWRSFLDRLDGERIAEAERSLCALLGVADLRGKSFLDAGCGSGLFSLAAHRLGAGPLCSFDYDVQSVHCAEELRRRYAADDAAWTIRRGSVLDGEFLRELGAWDVVYSWGVLHHTGRMSTALANVAQLVRPGGTLAVAIYNEQGWRSRFWTVVKRVYNGGTAGRLLVEGAFVPAFAAAGAASDLIRLRNPLRRYADYKRSRGMSLVHDWRDWLGGYPFETAKPEALEAFFRERGFSLVRCNRDHGWGCNELVFTRG